ncbi:hypothetical protein [Aeropyrum camini]|uniref:hypothetical protein n=1 Tax=Aeropyrum camini TaxID=229980 RepID=UPI0007874818|nr:hypothetical protein [Aeropyrum camini]
MLDSSRRILPLYNPVSFMLNSFFSTPIYYLEEVYGFGFQRRDDMLVPEDEDARGVFEVNGVRLRVLLDPGKAGDWRVTAIVGHEPGSTGFEIHRLNCIIYALHSYISSTKEGGEGVLKRFFHGIRNEYEYYIEVYRPLLENAVDIDNAVSLLESCSREKASTCGAVHGIEVYCNYQLEECSLKKLLTGSRRRELRSFLLNVGLLSFLGLAAFHEDKVYLQRF